MHHPAPARHRVEQHAHPGEVDLAFHPGLAVDHRYRSGPPAALILGAFVAVTMQGTVGNDHALAGQQVTDLDYSQPFVDPPLDLDVVGAQHIPRLPMAVRAVWTDHGHHRADQRVIELVDTACPVQARGHRGLDIASGSFPVHPGLGGHRPQSVAGQPRSKNLTNLDHRNLPKHRRTPSRDFDVK
jgi:hypothetical protein